MSAPGRWRRIALALARHAASVVPGARSPWADAMRCELDYIADDRAALRWALGCVMAGYAARLAAVPRPRWRIVSAPVVAGSLLLLVGFVLQGHATDQTEPSRPAFEDATCDRPDATPDRERRLRPPPIDPSQQRKDPRPC